MGLLDFIVELLAGQAPAPKSPPRTASSRSSAPRRIGYLWQERGWRRCGDTLRGYFRTQRGSYEGRIEGAGEHARYFIIAPPKRLLSGEHGVCFREQGKDEFLVHWNRPPPHVDDGILTIEKLIREA